MGLPLTVVGVYLTIKGNKAIKHGREVASIARRNVLTQVAAGEIAGCISQASILQVHVAAKSWDLAYHIVRDLATRLHQSKASFSEIKGIQRDILEVAARTASDMNQYLTATTDTEDVKIQRVLERCNDLAILLGDIYGALKLRVSEGTIL